MNKNIVSILFLTLVLTGCGNQNEQQKSSSIVKTMTIADYTQKRTTLFPGKVIASDEAKLAFRIAGPISRIDAKPGMLVHKGQVLATLEARDYAVQLAATEAEYNRIKAEADRIIELHKEKSISDNDYDKAVYALQQISAKLNAHRNALADTRLVAPFDGYIQEPLFKAGETVGAGIPVLIITGMGTPEVEINIPANEFLNRKNFDSFDCTVNSFPDKVFPLELVSIDPMANLNQLYRVRLRFKPSRDEVIPSAGMSAMVNISYRKKENDGELVPVTALWEKDGKTFVWVVEDKEGLRVTARQVKVEEIFRNGQSICQGLDANLQVVVAGVHALKEGQSVRLLPEITESNVGGLL